MTGKRANLDDLADVVSRAKWIEFWTAVFACWRDLVDENGVSPDDAAALVIGTILGRLDASRKADATD